MLRRNTWKLRALDDGLKAHFVYLPSVVVLTVHDSYLAFHYI